MPVSPPTSDPREELERRLAPTAPRFPTTKAKLIAKLFWPAVAVGIPVTLGLLLAISPLAMFIAVGLSFGFGLNRLNQKMLRTGSHQQAVDLMHRYARVVLDTLEPGELIESYESVRHYKRSWLGRRGFAVVTDRRLLVFSSIIGRVKCESSTPRKDLKITAGGLFLHVGDDDDRFDLHVQSTEQRNDLARSLSVEPGGLSLTSGTGGEVAVVPDDS